MPRFTSNQLTILLVAAMLSLALSAGAVAAGVTKVAISGKGGKTAQVTNGRLKVGATVEGTVPTTVQGTVQSQVQGTVQSQVQGTVQSQVQGTVTTQVADPRSYRSAHGFIATEVCVPLITAPADAGLIVTQVKVNVFDNPTPGMSNNVRLNSNSECEASVGVINPPTVGLFEIVFSPGYALAPGTSLYGTQVGGVQAEFDVDAYQVPAGSVPARQAAGGEIPAANR